ncbi:hypothetical protein A5482_009440 [Cyanobacterium sp. IPPAS B-1200]|uniref:hypothetical protein n=1 Tax=Cyanobacterium sp. IPPAS B-1200 TaxID=1562720 RepID=UPI0008528C58|nr:hypothetical protein [Cyanobacterium sp. IPPAS B-1200]OEJ80207.1 hypothetical protein A5482_07050 [Cyanobacterium sp. IPPAS B-1200]
MNPNPAIMKSVEKLDYRVTVGDVASESGLDVALAQRELLALASEAGGHLQVAQTGDMVYAFPNDFRTILRNRYWKLRAKQWLSKAWEVIFYLIRISFGILLIASIVILAIAIALIVIGLSASRGDNDNRSSNSRGGGGMMFMPNFWLMPNSFSIFSPRYHRNNYYYQQSYQGNVPPQQKQESELNFLESIYSFLFGDGNPNPNLEERRWQEIGAVIQNNQGAVIAEQIAPYLDNINIYNERDEDYMLPVLTRFNGYPEVSETGDIIYYFPELQVKASVKGKSSIAPYLEENKWQFSIATSSQKIMAFGLGAVYFILVLVFYSLTQQDISALSPDLVSFVDFVRFIYPILVSYSVAYLTVPLIRYFWLQTRNNKIEKRNENRQERAGLLIENKQELQPKINYARQFATQKILSEDEMIYSTDRDMLDNLLED